MSLSNMIVDAKINYLSDVEQAKKALLHRLERVYQVLVECGSRKAFNCTKPGNLEWWVLDGEVYEVLKIEGKLENIIVLQENSVV